jgi:hypothetical protein
VIREVIMETSGIQTASARLLSYVSRVVFFPFPPRNDSSRINASRNRNLDRLASWSPDTRNGPKRADGTHHGCHNNKCSFSLHIENDNGIYNNQLVAESKL